MRCASVACTVLLDPCFRRDDEGGCRDDEGGFGV